MISSIGLYIIEHIPLSILEVGVTNGWTIYDVLEKIFC